MTQDVSCPILSAFPRPVLNFSFWWDALCKGSKKPQSEMEIRFHLDLARINIPVLGHQGNACMGLWFFLAWDPILVASKFSMRISGLHLGSMENNKPGRLHPHRLCHVAHRRRKKPGFIFFCQSNFRFVTLSIKWFCSMNTHAKWSCYWFDNLWWKQQISLKHCSRNSGSLGGGGLQGL